MLNILATGFGYHADFISGWESNFLQSAVEQCTNDSGLLSDCPIFTLQTEDVQRKCSMPVPPALASEKLTGVIGDSLPGNVVIQYGPGPAIGNKPATESTLVPVPSVGYSAGTTASASAYLPGGVFKENPTSTPEVNALAVQEPSSTSTSTPTPTPTPIPTPSDPPVPEGYTLLRTDYVTNGHVVSKVVIIETVEYVQVATETVTVTATFGGEKARRELVHLHRHRHGSH